MLVAIDRNERWPDYELIELKGTVERLPVIEVPDELWKEYCEIKPRYNHLMEAIENLGWED